MQDLTLSDGTVLPKGSYVGTDVQNAVFENSTLDDPYKFDGMRYLHTIQELRACLC